MKKSKQARKRDFTPRAREEMWVRDRGCIFCRMGYHNEEITSFEASIYEAMHFIPKSQGGLGIAQNGAIGCKGHHVMLDNGNEGRRKEMLQMFEEYLKQHYPFWEKMELIYDKWRFLNGNGGI